MAPNFGLVVWTTPSDHGTSGRAVSCNNMISHHKYSAWDTVPLVIGLLLGWRALMLRYCTA